MRARTTAYDLGQIYEEHLAQLGRGEVRAEKRKRYRQHYQLFVCLGLGGLLAEMLIARHPPPSPAEPSRKKAPLLARLPERNRRCPMLRSILPRSRRGPTIMAMSLTIESAIAPLLHSPLLPEIVDTLQSRIREEAACRRRFYEDLRDDQKAEFVDGQVILHSPARSKHLTVRKHLEKLLDTYVSLRALGQVHGEKCLCVFPRNDYEPDVVFFGPERAAGLQDDTMRFPVPDFVAEVLSESTEDRDRGVKFEDYESHGVAEYWIIDPGAEVVEQYLRRGDRFYLALKSGSGEIASPTVAGFCIPIRALFHPAENLAALRRLMSS